MRPFTPHFILACILALCTSVAAQDEPYLGEILMTATNFAPRGYALCNGQLLPINQNQALFSILGTTYGGDGRVTFGLPDLRGRSPLGTQVVSTPGEVGGALTGTLSQSQMPTHNHDAVFTSNSGPAVLPVGSTGGGQYLPQTGGYINKGPASGPGAANIFASSSSQSSATTLVGGITPVGNIVVANQMNAGPQPFNTLPNFGAVTYMIAITGVFPSQN